MRVAAALLALLALASATQCQARDRSVETDADFANCLANRDSCNYLDLSYRNLTGTMPTEIGEVSGLMFLDVQGNNLSGTLPTEVAKLSFLKYMDFGIALPRYSHSGIGGSIPTELGQLEHLSYLALGGDITGTIPRVLGNLDKLVVLSLKGNLTGTLPTELGMADNLHLVFLPWMRLSGTIPTELGKLDKMLTLWLYRNQLTGPIPTEIGKLSLLDNLIVGSNMLTGTLPTELGSLTSLTTLRVYDNNLTGTFPPALFENDELNWWSSYNNTFTGVLPVEFVQRLAALHPNALYADPWNMPNSPSTPDGVPRLQMLDPPPPPPAAAHASTVGKADGGGDDIILPMVFAGLAALVILSVVVMWFLRLGCFKTDSTTQLDFILKTPEDWLTEHTVSGSFNSSSGEQHSDANVEVSFWQMAQSKSATMISRKMRRGSESVKRSLVTKLDGPIASMQGFVNNPLVSHPPRSSSVWEVTPPADVMGIRSLNLGLSQSHQMTENVTTESPPSPISDLSAKTNGEHLKAASPSASKQTVPSTEEASASRRTPTGGSSSSQGSDVAPTLRCGERIVSSSSGRAYKMLEYLTQGSFGVVWKMRDILTGELFVLKMPLRRKHIAMFVQEAELHRSLVSPFIVAFVEWFKLPEGWPVMVLEACHFGSSGALLTAVRISQQKYVEEVVVNQVLLHVLQGLSYLHGMGVVHRDIKLDNVMVDEALTFKLGDMGTAKQLDGTVKMLSTFAGTPVYMAPEVLRRDPYSEKSDIWSLGHMLYELCSQQHLFSPSTLESLVRKHDEPYKGIDQSYYSAGLVATVAWMLTQDPAERPSANDVLACPYVKELLQKELHEQVELRNSLRGPS